MQLTHSGRNRGEGSLVVAVVNVGASEECTLYDLVNHTAKAQVEEAILNSGLDYVFLHPARFLQNYLVNWKEVVHTGRLEEPWSTKTRFSRVDYRDVADVATLALIDDRLFGGTYELCAAGVPDSEAVAAMLTERLGRSVRAERIDPARAASGNAPMRAMFDHYDRMGRLTPPLNSCSAR